MLAALGRFNNNGIQHQQCNNNPNLKFQNVPQSSQISHNPVVSDSKLIVNKKTVDPVVQKKKLITNLLMEKDAQTKATVRLASEIVKNDETIVANNKLESKKVSIKDEDENESETEIEKEDSCNCLPINECPSDKKDFTFGLSCKMGMVRCCSIARASDDDKNHANTTTVSSNFDSITPKNQIITANPMPSKVPSSRNQTSGDISSKIEERITNHRKSGENATMSLSNQEPPYRRYATPITDSSYYHRIQPR